MDEEKKEPLSAAMPVRSQTLIPASLEKDMVVIAKPRCRIPAHGTAGGGVCDGITSVLHFPF